MDFKNPYNRSQYINFFRNQLLPEDFEEYDEKIETSFQPKFIQKIVKIGEVRSLDMNIYEIIHHSENDPRISLSRDSFRLLAHYGIKRALILFVSENPLNYRLSLVTIDLKWEEGKRVQREYSNPRRYSFFLGPETKTHTPETYLIKKGRVKDFDDLKERFSLEIVNKDFYTQIAILFTKLAGGERTIGRTQFDEKGILMLPSTNDDKIKKEFSVRLIGRLVFCWFLKKKCSDKGTPLLPEELLSSKAITQKSDYYHNILEPLFFETLNKPIKERKKEYQLPPWAQIPFLNGGLFTNEYNDYYEIDQLGISKYINTLKVPDDWLKELFDIFEIYNFTIDENTSVDVELSIEPEMLGRIFENLLAEINPETGNSARKSTGSYYTPRPIVEYMVNESLKQYLLTKINLDENKISSLLAYEEEEVGLSESENDAIIDALDVIKIIDPACGSGAFPMGILQKMLLILQKIDPESKKWLNKKVSQIENTIVREEFQKKIEAENWNYVHKLGIIQSSIYGVDIQSIAVDISKLRFFLSLIVDENVDDSKENRGIDSLPNLEFKFVCANSLIGLPGTLVGSYEEGLQPKIFETVDNITKLKKLREEYFRCHGDEKKSIEKKFQEIQSEMFLSSLKWLNWGGGDSQTVKLSQWNPFSNESCEWFDPDWMFGVKDGFDVVIGNPPYISHDKIKDKDILKKQYKSYEPFADFYCYFIEKAVQLQNKRGLLNFITSNSYLRAEYGSPIRKLLRKQNKILCIINLENVQIFENAIVNVAILISTKNHIENKCFVVNASYLGAESFYNFIEKNGFNYEQVVFDSKSWNLIEPAQAKLQRIIERAGETLEELGVKIRLGLATGYNNAFVIDESRRQDFLSLNPKNGEIIKPLLRGRDISHYSYEAPSLYILLTKNGVNVKRDYPDIYRYLDSFEDSFKKRGAKGQHWTNLRACAFFEDFKKEKIIWIELSDRGRFALCTDEIYLLNSAYFLLPPLGIRSKYLLAILNSKLIHFYLQIIAETSGMGTSRWINNYVKKFPLPKVADEKQNEIITIVDQIIFLTQSYDYRQNLVKQAKVKECEKQIDQMVYKLYDLTDGEIEIIENFHKKA